MTVTAERHMEASVWSGGWGGAGSAKQLLTLVNIVTLMVLISLFTRTVFILLLLLSCSVVSDSATPWTAARQVSLSSTTSRSLLKCTSNYVNDAI